MDHEKCRRKTKENNDKKREAKSNEGKKIRKEGN